MSEETTDRVPRSLLRKTGEWTRHQVVDHTEVLLSLAKSNDERDARVMRLIAVIALGAMLLSAIITVLVLGGTIKVDKGSIHATSIPVEDVP